MDDQHTLSGPSAARALLSRLTSISSSPPPPTTYPPICSIPQTSPTRLSHPTATPTPFPSYPIPSTSLSTQTQPSSILYLAYGSNLCAETFLGVRGIRPLSQINVTAPSLRLTFDLPGIPYREPCFANTALRKIPSPPKMPPGGPDLPDWPPAPHTGSYPGDPTWSKGLIGVVYEVTQEDYAKILATEGGGASYADILTPCFPLPARMGVPEKPDYPELPKMFLAHTLFAPRVPSKLPGDRDDGKTSEYVRVGGNSDGNRKVGDGDDDDTDDGLWEKMPAWLKRLFLPVTRPDGTYAQPSARYLKLIRDGAREHELPDEYQAYLARLQPYTITTFCQKMGMVLFLLLWALPFAVIFFGGRMLADEDGRVPRWVAMLMALVSNLVWLSYDWVFKPVFGDGERTLDEERKGLWSRTGRGIRLEDEESVGEK